MGRRIVPPVAVEYPSGDGKPMAENDARLLAIHYAIGALRLECPHQAGDAATGHRERAGQRWARTAAGVIRPPAFGEFRSVD